jgi:hypothetical protein
MSERYPIGRGPQEYEPISWWLVSFLVALLFLIGVPTALVGFMITIWVGVALMTVGSLYAVVFVPVVLWRWHRALAEIGAPETATLSGPSRFQTTNQRAALLIDIVLVLNLIAVGWVTAVGRLNPLESDPAGTFDPFVGNIFIAGAIAVIGALPLIVLDARRIADRSHLRGESLALKTSTGAPRLILLHRVLSVTVWCGYPIASLLATVPNLLVA